MVSRHLTRRTSPRGGAFHGLFPAPCPVPFRARLRQQIKVAIDLGIWDGSRTSAAHGALYIYTNNLVLIQSTLFPSYRRNESIIALYRYNYKEIGGNCVRGDFCSISDPRPLFSLKCRTLSASTPNHDQTRRWRALGLVLFLSFTQRPDFPRAILFPLYGPRSRLIPRKPFSVYFKRRSMSSCSCR